MRRPRPKKVSPQETGPRTRRGHEAVTGENEEEERQGGRTRALPHCIMRGQDIAAPVKTVTLEGKTYELVFSNKAARIAEDVYNDQYGRDANYLEILKDMAAMKHRALLAVVYGALIAGGGDMTYDAFEEAFTYDCIDALREIIRKGVFEALPEADGKN